MMDHLPREPETLEVELLDHAAYGGCGVLMLDPGEAERVALEKLVAAGLLRDCGRVPWCAGETCYRVTDRGREVAAELRERRTPRLSRSQRRYLSWLRADCGLPFGEWLRLGAERRTPAGLPAFGS